MSYQNCFNFCVQAKTVMYLGLVVGFIINTRYNVNKEVVGHLMQHFFNHRSVDNFFSNHFGTLTKFEKWNYGQTYILEIAKKS